MIQKRINSNQSINKIYSLIGFPIGFCLVILLILGFLVPLQAIETLRATLGSLIHIFPFILLSVVVAAYLKASGSDQIVASTLNGKPIKAVAIASVFGALSPFCSCGVIPLVAGLLVAGVPIAPVLAFCIASPIMDPEMFILTTAELGFKFAIIKTFSAITMGLMAGYSAFLISKTGYLNDALKDIAKPSCSDSCSNEDKVSIIYKFWNNPQRRQVFINETLSVGLFLSRWLAFAFLLESLMLAYVPNDLIVNWLGVGSTFALPLAVMLGIPAYLNGYAAIPLVGGLIKLGMSPAVGLTFMLSGSVTSIPAAIAIYSLAKPRLVVLYLIIAAVGSMTAGYLFSLYLIL
tara:strand:+ start:762 stop:1805 length:1044 start_codon:yes stop_codon:yes gene_type:complete